MARGKKSPVGLSSDKEGTGNSAFLSTGLGSADFYLPLFCYLSIPREKSPTAYVSSILTLPVCRINGLIVQFPPGCAGLVGIQVWRASQQIFPLPAGQWLVMEGGPIRFAFTHYVDTNPFDIQIRGYNTDDRYDHTPWVAIEMQGLPSETNQTMMRFLETLKG